MKKTFGSLILCVMMLLSAAAGEGRKLQMELIPEEWSWEANAVCTMIGMIHTSSEGIRNVTLRLEVETEPETDQDGRIVFTAVDGNKVKIRRQSDSYMIEEVEGELIVEF